MHELHADSLRRVLERSIPIPLRHRFDAEDIVQSTFLKAFLNIASFQSRGGRSFEFWLRRIARRELVDRIRHHTAAVRTPSREEGRGGPAVLGLVDKRSLGPMSSLIVEEEGRRLARAVGRLPARDRSLLHLRFERQLPWRLVAGKVRRCVPEARRRLHQALEVLRREIG